MLWIYPYLGNIFCHGGLLTFFSDIQEMHRLGSMDPCKHYLASPTLGAGAVYRAKIQPWGLNGVLASIRLGGPRHGGVTNKKKFSRL